MLEKAEDEVTIPKFRGPQDNFLLWAARIEAFMDEKEEIGILEKEEDLGKFTTHEKKKAARPPFQ